VGVERATKPVRFRRVMNYEWIRIIVLGIAGLFILRIARKANRSDPLSPTFQSNSSLDDSLDECGRVLDAELHKKHSPLR
jgi:hypothetical protein